MTQPACVAKQGVDEEDASQALVAVDSLGGRQMHLYLHKRPGYEAEDVLGGDDMDGLGGVSPECQASLDLNRHAVLSRARGVGIMRAAEGVDSWTAVTLTGCCMPVELE